MGIAPEQSDRRPQNRHCPHHGEDESSPILVAARTRLEVNRPRIARRRIARADANAQSADRGMRCPGADVSASILVGKPLRCPLGGIKRRVAPKLADGRNRAVDITDSNGESARVGARPLSVGVLARDVLVRGDEKPPSIDGPVHPRVR